MSTYCAAVLSPGPGSKAANDSGPSPAAGGSRARPGVKVLLIREIVEGFVLSRLTDGESAGDTQHDTLDEAMSQAYSEYSISAWKFCSDGVDPLEYVHERSGS
jgi:hypothetical protein